MIHAVRNRLPDFGNDTRNLLHVLADFVHDCGVRPAQRFRNDFDLALVYARSMFIALDALA